MSTTVNNIAYYTYGSPRYNAVKSFSPTKIPNDYSYHDDVNGTYDKWFPLYRLTSTEEPRLQLVNAEGQTYNITGTLALKPIQNRSFSQEYGAIKNGTEQPFNSNLEKQKVFYSTWSGIRLNPAWMTIQNRVDKSNPQKTVYTPVLLIRILGNETIVNGIHAIEISDTQKISNEEFPEGLFINYKKRLWKCIKKTRRYPPSTNQSTSEWQLYKPETDIFHADIFSLANEGQSGYMLEVTEEKRKFNPLEAGDDLVCWNLSYYH